MNFIRESFWKAYFVVFTLTCAGNLFALLHPHAEVFIYYQTMRAFLKPNWIPQAYAILAAIITIISLWPLFCRAFGLQRKAAGFFRTLLVLRVVADFFGHNYETAFMKAVFLNNPLAGWVTLAFFILFAFPSYKIHYDYVFPATRKATQPKRPNLDNLVI